MLKKLDSLFIAGKNKMEAALASKHNGFDGIVVAIGLILIVIILIIVFKNQIQSSMESSINSISTKINNMTTEMTGK